MRIRDWSSDVCSSDLVGLLRQLGETLVEVHGQFETHGLLNPQTHRDVLDAFAQTAPQAERTDAAWRDWRRADQAREPASSEERRVGKECVCTCRARRTQYD